MNARTYAFGHSRLTLRFGDITTSDAQVLVSSDDGMLTTGGGVSAAIRRAAGEVLLTDAAKHIPVPLGDVVVTSAGALKARYVFHAVTLGPSDRWVDPREVIRSTVRRCMALMDALDLSSIAFPAIGTGAAGFSLDDAAVEMSNTLAAAFRARARPVEATIYLFDRFGQRQPMDYVRFFELFSAHSSEFVKVVPEREEAPAGPVTESPEVRAEVDARRQRSARLAALSQERDALEAQLVEWADGLSAEKVGQVRQRLTELHQERITLLAEMRPPAPKGVPLFISYSHADEEWRMKLGRQLSPLERQGLITAWHDRMITPGQEWAAVIDEKIDAAQVVLLLVSDDFIASSYCYDQEMRRATERHAAGECRVIPVILRPVLWEETQFARFQVLPRGGVPVTTWTHADEALLDVARGVRTAIQDLLAQQARRRPGAAPAPA